MLWVAEISFSVECKMFNYRGLLLGYGNTESSIYYSLIEIYGQLKSKFERQSYWLACKTVIRMTRVKFRNSRNINSLKTTRFAQLGQCGECEEHRSCVAVDVN